MPDLALSLAREARRIGLATVVWRQRDRLRSIFDELDARADEASRLARDDDDD